MVILLLFRKNRPRADNLGIPLTALELAVPLILTLLGTWQMIANQ